MKRRSLHLLNSVLDLNTKSKEINYSLIYTIKYSIHIS